MARARAARAARTRAASAPAMLLAACPLFDEPWRSYVSDPCYEAGLLYLDLGELAHHLVRLHKAGETAEFEAVFRVVERLHTDADADVREAASLGMLEAIQNVAGNDELDSERFRPIWDSRARSGGTG